MDLGKFPRIRLGQLPTPLEPMTRLSAALSGPRLWIDHGTGSAGTQAGLLTGLVACHSRIPVLGISVRAPKAKQEASVLALAKRTVEHLGLGDIMRPEHVSADGDYVGAGYGIPTPGMVDAVRMLTERA